MNIDAQAPFGDFYDDGSCEIFITCNNKKERDALKKFVEEYQ